MKSRIQFCIIAGIVIVAMIVFNSFESNTKVVRYHQHLEQPSSKQLEEKKECGNEDELCTHLPIIQIDTNNQKIPGAAILDNEYRQVGFEKGPNGEEEILAKISTSETIGEWHTASDKADLQASAFVRCRGNSSRSFRKHGYKIKFVKEKNPTESVDLPFLGMHEESEWALHGPYLDKTLIRNYMFMNISAEIMGYAPNVRFCELIINGEYQGLYVLMETIKCGEGRVDLTKYRKGVPTSSYIIRLENATNPLKTIDNFSYYTQRLEKNINTNVNAEIVYPSLIDQTKLVKDFITSDFNEIERILYSSEMFDGSGRWKNYVDMNSFVDYFILNEFLMNSDVFSNSTYFYRDVRGKIHIGPVWDFNNVFDNFFRPVNQQDFLLARKGWYARLLTDDTFVEAIIHRYHELRDGVLSDSYLNKYLDETIAWLGPAIDRNFKVWGYSFDIDKLNKAEYRQPSIEKIKEIKEKAGNDTELLNKLLLEAREDENPKNFKEAIKQLRDCMKDRGMWMDEHIDTLRQFCSDSKNASEIVY